MTKEQLSQYIDLQAEKEENEEHIKKLRRDIDKLETDIAKIVDEGTVIDKVSGGDGGKQGFRIEGFPYAEYRYKLDRLKYKKSLLEIEERELKERQDVICPSVREIHDYMYYGVKDNHIRRIMLLRFEKGMSWQAVADAIGGGNTPDSVRKAVTRFLKS